MHFIVTDQSFNKAKAVQHIQNLVKTFAKGNNLNFIPCSKLKVKFEENLVKEIKTVHTGNSHTLIFIDRGNFDNLSGPMFRLKLPASSNAMFDITMLTFNSKPAADNNEINKVPCSRCEKTIIKMKTTSQTECTFECIDKLVQRMLCITGKHTDYSNEQDQKKNIEWAENDEYVNARNIADETAENEKHDDWETKYDAATKREMLAAYDAKTQRENLEDSIKQDQKHFQDTTIDNPWGYHNSPDMIGPAERRRREFHRREHAKDEKIRREHAKDEKIRREHLKFETIRRERVENENIRQQAGDYHVRRDLDQRKLETNNRIMQNNRMIDTKIMNDYMTRDNRINTRRPDKIQSKMSQENSYNHLAANLTTAVMHCMNDGNF